MVFTNLTATFVSRSFLERLTEATLRTIRRKGEIGIVAVGAVRMKKLNSRYRRQNRPTDVLAFPYETNALENLISSTKHEETLFGEVVICITVAKKQARLAGHSLKQELAALAVHGILHVCGYDHERSEEDEKIMFGLQERILNQIISKSSSPPRSPAGSLRVRPVKS